MTRRQTANGKQILTVVARRAHRLGWDPKRARQVGRMAIMCAMTEADLHIYGSTRFSESYALADYRPWWQWNQYGKKWMGSDHASVGLFQQQVPMWGSVQACMDPQISTEKFLDALHGHGEDVFRRPFGVYPDLANRVQMVQVSAYSTGSNYRANRFRSRMFMVLHWAFLARRVK